MRPTLVRTARLAAGACFDDNTALDLLGGGLPASRKAAVLAHAESCEACRELLADLASVAEPASEQAPDAPSHVGLWQLLERVGRGASGTVYRARNMQTGQLAAVKLVHDAGLRARFDREARALSTLQHPGIVRYIEHGQAEGGSMFLVMQWLDGHDLSQRLPAGSPVAEADRLTAREVLDLALRLAAALAHAHSRGCVHRDLSPKNVFLPGGVLDDAVILDFGLVRWVNPDAAHTASQNIVGTPYYMAPEQIRGVYDIDARADLFALGALLYQAAAGRVPFDGADLLSVWQGIVHAQHPDLGRQAPHLPRALVDLIGHLLEKAPSDRPASAELVLHALEAIRLDEPTPRSTRRLWLGLGAAVVGGATIVGLSAPVPVQLASAQPTTVGRRPQPEPTLEAPTEPAPVHTIHHLGGTKIERGQRYRTSGSELEGAAVVVMHGTLVLEDCIVEGPYGAAVMNDATLVLRRCKVDGDVRLMGKSSLRLEHTELEIEPQKLGFTGTITEKK